ncbi:uncharacterized protein LOC113332865 isoform X1 [Papaver somniferum]|uniref:uncharacterized protein LOC113332865 isoform X1 n=1 Tax=Papaver somniferum TaxID=3469 RepID=UPI000E6FFBDD|nr:uncharacterized protein LOC113332865 isoform X1 [Papaver somniferum]
MFIDSLAFDDEKLTKQFFSSCPLLERLVITNCEFPEMDLNFSFPELWEFDLVKCSGSSKNGRQSVDSKIILCVPKLQHFLSNDYMSRNYHLGDMPSLVVADLYNNYELDVDDDDEAPEIDTELPAGVKELYVERLNKFFRVVHNVEDLTLSCLSLEFASASIGSLDIQPLQLHNLKYLKLHTSLSRNSMNAVTNLLKISPNIESETHQ